MQTHHDEDYNGPLRKLFTDLVEPDETQERLEKRAAIEQAQSEITGGRDGEPVLGQGEKYHVYVTHRPDDPDCLRISVGRPAGMEAAYLVFRGPRDECISVLERALNALKHVTL